MHMLYIHYQLFLLVNGINADMNTVISHNDLICHLVHRHEPPVTSRPLTIVHMDQELVVIDKPPSIPVSDDSPWCLQHSVAVSF